jgi:hypothetical protein
MDFWNCVLFDIFTNIDSTSLSINTDP